MIFVERWNMFEFLLNVDSTSSPRLNGITKKPVLFQLIFLLIQWLTQIVLAVRFPSLKSLLKINALLGTVKSPVLPTKIVSQGNFKQASFPWCLNTWSDCCLTVYAKMCMALATRIINDDIHPLNIYFFHTYLMEGY